MFGIVILLVSVMGDQQFSSSEVLSLSLHVLRLARACAGYQEVSLLASVRKTRGELFSFDGMVDRLVGARIRCDTSYLTKSLMELPITGYVIGTSDSSSNRSILHFVKTKQSTTPLYKQGWLQKCPEVLLVRCTEFHTV